METETRADGNETSTYRQLCDGDPVCPTNGSFVVTTVTDGAPFAKAFQDKLLRTLRTESIALDGQAVLVDTQYDALGRETHKSEPYFGGSPGTVSPVGSRKARRGRVSAAPV